MDLITPLHKLVQWFPAHSLQWPYISGFQTVGHDPLLGQEINLKIMNSIIIFFR